jgi:hypothetical protein
MKGKTGLSLYLLNAIAMATKFGKRITFGEKKERKASSGKGKRNYSWPASGNGIQSMARRRRQIERGILTASNGLIKST